MIKYTNVDLHILKDYVIYDPITGIFTARKTTGRHGCHKAGRTLGTLSTKGYLRLRIGNVSVGAHRAAWAYMTGEWPTETIDHRNRVKSDNRWLNLREATWQQNMFNLPRAKNNTTGVSGVVKIKTKTGVSWKARLGKDYKNVYVGQFSTLEQAKQAIEAAKPKIHSWD